MVNRKSSLYFYMVAAFIWILAQPASAIKPCNNVSHCYNDPISQDFDRATCLAMADIVVTGQIRSLRAKPSSNVDQTFDIEIEKAEKGNPANLKERHFETACFDAELSVGLVTDKKQKDSRFRFYLKKSNKEKSGFRVIHFEKLN